MTQTTFDGMEYPAMAWLYVGILRANENIKIGQTRDVRSRVKQHRRHGIDVLAAWLGDPQWEIDFHHRNAQHRDRSCGIREIYWPHADVIEDLYWPLYDAEQRGEARLFHPRLPTIDHVTRLLDDLGGFYMEAFPTSTLDAEPDPDRWPTAEDVRANMLRTAHEQDAKFSRARTTRDRTPVPNPNPEEHHGWKS